MNAFGRTPQPCCMLCGFETGRDQPRVLDLRGREGATCTSPRIRTHSPAHLVSRYQRCAVSQCGYSGAGSQAARAIACVSGRHTTWVPSSGLRRLTNAGAHAARAQVEARLRQLEGRMQAGESARPRGKPEVSRYEPERQGGAALLTAPASYNPAADVTATAGKEEKKKARASRAPARQSACLPVWLGKRPCAGGGAGPALFTAPAALRGRGRRWQGRGLEGRAAVPSTVHSACDSGKLGRVSGMVTHLRYDQATYLRGEHWAGHACIHSEISYYDPHCTKEQRETCRGVRKAVAGW